MSDIQFEGTVALVTGAGRGIGLEVARQLAQQGMTVIAGVRDPEKSAEAIDGLKADGLNVTVKALDITDEQSIQQVVQEIESEFGGLDILVNNAAAFANWQETATSADLKQVHDTLETNLFGAWRVTQAFLPLLRKSKHARIVNVSSGAGSHADTQFGLTTGDGGTASYGISKAALNALTVKFALEPGNQSMRINAVCPGLTATAPGMEAMGARPVPEGAASVVWAALIPDDGPTGGFFRDGKPLGW